MSEGALGINLLAGNYSWLNTEHPIGVKFIYAVIYFFTGSAVAIRFLQLAFSLVVLFILYRHIISEYSMRAVIPLVILLLLDGTFYHFTYLLFLDTLMLNVLLLGIYFMLKKRYSHAAFLFGLTPFFKEVAVVFVFAVLIYLYLRDDMKSLRLALATSIASIAVGYGTYLFFTTPQEIANSLLAITIIQDPFACESLCLFTLRFVWSLFDFYPLYLWIWFAGIIALALKEVKGLRVTPEETLPYFVVIIYILFLALVQIKRSVYPFYFASAVALSVFPFKDVEDVIAEYFKSNFQKKLRKQNL